VYQKTDHKFDRRSRLIIIIEKLLPYALAGFDLTTLGSSLLGGRPLDHAARADVQGFLSNFSRHFSKFSPEEKKSQKRFEKNTFWKAR
jgi:hypothetical protein